MASLLKTGYSVSRPSETVLGYESNGFLMIRPSIASLQSTNSNSKDFMGKPLIVGDQKGFRDLNCRAPKKKAIHAQSSICVSRAMRWWEKTLKPNMVEIHSAQELVDSLKNAGDRLVILDFYSPGCGGCRTLHPKICQIAESNPNALILKVNYDDLKKMCHCLHIHVLPFFRFYRGAEGRLCSFSCTNSTIKKFKDALAKFGTGTSNVGPAKGLDESELMSLASIGEISTNVPFPSNNEERVDDLVIALSKSVSVGNIMEAEEEKKAVVMA